jgi:putative addiction module component (TIGR02574 family)
MDRSFEQVRTEVLEWDPESQEKLVEEIRHHLAEKDEEYDSVRQRELTRRLESHRRGEGTYVTKEQMMDMAEKMISAAEQKRQ